MKRYPLIILAGLLAALSLGATEPIRIGIVGMVHGHVNGFLRREYAPTLEIVGFDPHQSTEFLT
jgi:hypothetical protein